MDVLTLTGDESYLSTELWKKLNYDINTRIQRLREEMDSIKSELNEVKKEINKKKKEEDNRNNLSQIEADTKGERKYHIFKDVTVNQLARTSFQKLLAIRNLNNDKKICINHYRLSLTFIKDASMYKNYIIESKHKNQPLEFHILHIKQLEKMKNTFEELYQIYTF